METTDQKENKQLHIRVPMSLYEKIDNSGLSDTAAVTKALELFFNTTDESKNNQLVMEIDQLKAQNNEMVIELDQLKANNEQLVNETNQFKAVMVVKDDRIADLQKSLGWLQLEFTRLNDRLQLPSAKKWYKFW